MQMVCESSNGKWQLWCEGDGTPYIHCGSRRALPHEFVHEPGATQFLHELKDQLERRRREGDCYGPKFNAILQATMGLDAEFMARNAR